MSACRTFTCATQGCQSTIHLHHDIEAKLRRTHETFYCPAGHSNYFARFREMWHEALESREDWKIRAKTCPFGCGFRVLHKRLPESIEAALAFHLVEEHGATMPAPVEAEVV